METLTIALAQIEGSTNPTINLEKAKKAIKEAVTQKAALIVFPEMLMAVATQNIPLQNHATTLDQGFARQLANLARQYKISICAGIWEKSCHPQKVYNTAVVFAADGKLLACYRKLHLFDAFALKESEIVVAGAEPPPLFTLAGFTIGLGICYDLRFPEHFRHLSAQGAEIILLPAAWYRGKMKKEAWQTLLRARAIENCCFIGGTSLTGKHFIGNSAAFDPLGVPLKNAEDKETIITFTASKKRLQQIRKTLPALTHRRNDIFG